MIKKAIYVIYLICFLFALFYPTITTVIIFFAATALCYLGDGVKKQDHQKANSQHLHA